MYSLSGVKISKAVVSKMRTMTTRLMEASTLIRFRVTEAFSSNVSLLRITSLYLSLNFSASLRFLCTISLSRLMRQAVKLKKKGIFALNAANCIQTICWRIPGVRAVSGRFLPIVQNAQGGIPGADLSQHHGPVQRVSQCKGTFQGKSGRI